MLSEMIKILVIQFVIGNSVFQINYLQLTYGFYLFTWKD